MPNDPGLDSLSNAETSVHGERSGPRSIASSLRYATGILGAHEAGWREVEILLGHVLGVSRTHLRTWPERRLSPPQAEAFDGLLRQRAAGTPIAYLVGNREFWSLQLEVNPHTLIPRPETELLVELALERLEHANRGEVVADLGTGCGAIALAIASERPHACVVATDLSCRALSTARRNAARHGLERVSFAQGSWCTMLRYRCVSVIVSNPPYVTQDDPHLTQGDVRFEPRTALAGGRDGLDAIRTIVPQARKRLVVGGHLLLEHGHDQGKAVGRILLAGGFRRVQCHRDLAGHRRATSAVNL